MTLGEVAWRTGRAAHGLVARPDSERINGLDAPDWDRLLRDFRTGQGRPVLLDERRMRLVAERCPEQTAEIIAAADRAVASRFQFFGYPEIVLPQPVDWNYDPIAEVHWPKVAATRIDHRRSAADPKWIWELNRLQHLPWLAQAWLLTRDERYADTAFEHLDSWLEQNPPGRGISWRGAFEAGLRAISVALAVQGLRTSRALTKPRYRRILAFLDQSAHRCWNDRSLYSSANNHLVGELAGYRHRVDLPGCSPRGGSLALARLSE
jgi:hypothetical protein